MARVEETDESRMYLDIHSIDPGNNHTDSEQSLLHTSMKGNPIAFVSVARVVV